MDAVTLVAAAVAIAVDQARNAALEDCLLERERAAMRAEDLACRIAQRMYTRTTQLPSALPPMTWQVAHTIAYNEAMEMRDVMDEARRALRRGHEDRALALLDAELDRGELESDAEPADDSDEPVETSEEEPPSEPPSPILRRCAGCGGMSASVTLQWPAGRWTGLPEEERMLCDDCEAAEP